jgi:hypothetical protein
LRASTGWIKWPIIFSFKPRNQSIRPSIAALLKTLVVLVQK